MKLLGSILALAVTLILPIGNGAANTATFAEKGHFLLVHSGDLMGYLEECG